MKHSLILLVREHCKRRRMLCLTCHIDKFRNDIYFAKVHPCVPVLHKQRYLAACMDSSVNRQPALFLRYAVWALACTLSDKYRSHEIEFYRRGRKYIQLDEMRVSPSPQQLVVLPALTMMAGCRGTARHRPDFQCSAEYRSRSVLGRK